MKITIDIDLVNEEIIIVDEIGNKDEATPVGHDFWEVCPEHIGLSLNYFLSENWNSYKVLVRNPEYLRLREQYDKLLIEKTRLYVKAENMQGGYLDNVPQTKTK